MNEKEHSEQIAIEGYARALLYAPQKEGRAQLVNGKPYVLEVGFQREVPKDYTGIQYPVEPSEFTVNVFVRGDGIVADPDYDSMKLYLNEPSWTEISITPALEQNTFSESELFVHFLRQNRRIRTLIIPLTIGPEES